MASFALISEGNTDHAVITGILNAHYDFDPDVTELQPLRDSTDNNGLEIFGGWEKVFEFCALPTFEENFLFNDFVIIQIDTDCGEEANFGVPLTNQGVDRAEADIIADVKDLLISKIPPGAYDKYKKQILFAISVHSLECWLVPLYVSGVSASKTKNCAHHLSRMAGKHGVNTTKEYRGYAKMAKEFKKKGKLLHCTKASESLRIFVDALPNVSE